MALFNLLSTQKDSLFKILVDSGFNPLDFSWENKGFPALCYKYDNYYCKFQMSDDYLSRMVVFSPGNLIQEEYYAKNMDNWQAYENGFKIWLQNLKKELSAEFLWEKLQSESTKVSISNNIINDPFLPSEKDMIRLKFVSIKSKFRSLDLNEVQLNKIDEKLDHLLELTEKLDKIDWLSILIGSVAGLVLNLLIDQDTIRTIWEIIKNEFEIWLFLPQ